MAPKPTTVEPTRDRADRRDVVCAHAAMRMPGPVPARSSRGAVG